MRKAKDKIYESVFVDYPDVVTVEQMSEMLGISTKTAYRMLRKNVIEHFMIGRIYKIPKYHILTYLNLLEDRK
ncbi:helix-turn-helix domain-containing protein [Blautia coccoides]|mgnify:CR=1 FL=1|uniref:Helix-turn-helix domain-containing protein n=1 Tax=Blautia hominis TaxID=2025493 RepID=A0ABQ0BKR5_9FIRM|nr:MULTISPECIES: helix-turn-helix domain-containing protein [Blautia]MCB5873721.1 helix-turn-helix domain-containing protein [Blautia producta]MCQ4640918.1 helix-turn-helix domain-containing protein [Blautia coccoides]